MTSMAGNTGPRERARPWLRGVRQRAAIGALAALLALMNGSWIPAISLRGGSGTSSTMMRIQGTRFDLECHGAGAATVLIYSQQSIAGVINNDVKAALARSVRLCTLTVTESSVRIEAPPIAKIMTTMLASSGEPTPWAIVTHGSRSSAFDPAPGKLSGLVAGVVLVHPSPSAPTGLVVATDGTNWPLPVGDSSELVLAILKLFWPPEE